MADAGGRFLRSSNMRTLIACILLALASCSVRTGEAEQGVLDLRSWDSQSDVISLDGEWLFAPGLSPRPADFQVVRLPADSDFHSQKIETGCVTLKLKLRLPESVNKVGLISGKQLSSHRILWNERVVAGAGTPACSAPEYEPSLEPSVSFWNVKGGDSEIVLQIANFDNYEISAGRILLGSEKTAQTFLLRRVAGEIVTLGALIIVAFYHLGLFALRRRELSHLMVGVLCITGLAHFASSGIHLVPLYLNLPYSMYVRTDYISWFFAGSVFVHYTVLALRLTPPVWIVPANYATSVALTLFTLFTKPILFTQITPFFEVAFAVQCAYSLYLLLDGMRRDREGARLLFAGAVILFAAIVNDGLNEKDIIHTQAFAPAGLLVFLAFEGLVTARGFASAFGAVEDLSVRLIDTNQAYTRFMPAEFLGYMEKESITDVRLGDHIQKEMTVVFADIRDFTAMSEKMTPAETFEFLNGYLSRVGHIIRDHEGWIDKYIGDGIMALFPRSADDAVKSAIEMQHEILRYNKERATKGRSPIHVGIGIHTGTLIMGIIGENERMEGTVISDVVNVASRIEHLTKVYASSILISGETLVNLEDSLAYHFRLLGRVPVKGKSRPVSVVEILDGRPELEVMLATKVEFEKGFNALMIGHDQDAIRCFEYVLSQNPADGAAALYLSRLRGTEDPSKAIFIPSL